MKYIVKKEKKETKILNYSTIEGFLLPTKSNKFIIDGNNITKIIIINKKFASPFVSKIVLKKYQKLIKKLTDLFISEEDPGTTMKEGKKRMRQIGNVEIPQKAFMSVLKLDDK